MTNRPRTMGPVRFSAYDVLPVHHARDVIVVPATDVVQGVPNGGPLLKDPEHAAAALHMRGGLPVGAVPEAPAEIGAQLEGSFVWGGFLPRDPTALAGEYSARLLTARHHRPEDPALFVARPGLSKDDYPARIWDILDWFGYPRDRVHLIDTPTHVADLWIAPQAEQTEGIGPSYSYLELLAQNATERGLAPDPVPLSYVSRAPLGTDGGTLYLGETYLAHVLSQLGVQVLDTSTLPLEDVLNGFAASQALVIAAGPGMRVRQLLGYYEQSITVLPHRPDGRGGLHNLMPRVRQMAYAPVMQGMLTLLRRNGQPDSAAGLSVYDEDALLRVFERHGLAIRDAWDRPAYQAACSSELAHWLARQFDPERRQKNAFDWDASIVQIRSDIDRFGLGFARDEAERRLQRRAEDA